VKEGGERFAAEVAASWYYSSLAHKQYCFYGGRNGGRAGARIKAHNQCFERGRTLSGNSDHYPIIFGIRFNHDAFGAAAATVPALLTVILGRTIEFVDHNS
jgi:hypothetical protein